jgi:prepilin-type N-terminal cleavage/methylation domain-containing protein
MKPAIRGAALPAGQHTRHPAIRGGFTLVELLIVVVIVGILATLGIVQFDKARAEAHAVTLRADMAQLALHQELFHQQWERYAELSELKDFKVSAGVVPVVVGVSTNRFAVTMTHNALPGRICGYYMGDSAPGDAGPATVPGQVFCE